MCCGLSQLPKRLSKHPASPARRPRPVHRTSGQQCSTNTSTRHGSRSRVRIRDKGQPAQSLGKQPTECADASAAASRRSAQGRSHVGGLVNELLAHVVHAIAVQAEAILLVLALHDVADVLAHKLDKLFKHKLQLLYTHRHMSARCVSHGRPAGSAAVTTHLFCQRPHGGQPAQPRGRNSRVDVNQGGTLKLTVPLSGARALRRAWTHELLCTTSAASTGHTQ